MYRGELLLAAGCGWFSLAAPCQQRLRPGPGVASTGRCCWADVVLMSSSLCRAATWPTFGPAQNGGLAVPDGAPRFGRTGAGGQRPADLRRGLRIAEVWA
jgi:hypothetical protein